MMLLAHIKAAITRYGMFSRRVMRLRPNECILLVEHWRATPARDQISSMPINYSPATWANPFILRGWPNHFIAVTTHGVAANRLGHGSPFVTVTGAARR
jgi:hypothetical protein